VIKKTVFYVNFLLLCTINDYSVIFILKILLVYVCALRLIIIYVKNNYLYWRGEKYD